MKLDLTIKYVDSYDCLDNLVVDAAKWFGKEYALLFADAWGFCYKPIDELNGETFGANMQSGGAFGWEYIEKYHGLKVSIIPKTTYQDILDIVRIELKEKRPVIIYMDTFWCPWYKGYYQQLKAHHYCLVTDIDDNNNLYIVDNQMATNGAILSESNFSNGFGECMIFTLKEHSSVNADWKKIIQRAVDRVINPIGGISCFEQMRKFANDIQEKLDLNQEVISYESNPFKAPVFQSLFKLGQGRKQFSLVLDYIGNSLDKPELIILSDKLKIAGEKWVSLFGMTCKAYYRQGIDREKIVKRVVNKIYEIALEEELIASKLMEICINGKISELDNIMKCDEQDSKKSFNNISYIDISKQMNSEGFSSSLLSDTKAEISDGGRYFLTEGLSSKREWVVENMRFLFPEVDKGVNDNISCFGQIIEVQQCKYTHIMILGCAELGNHLELIEIEYHDGKIESIPFRFTSWLSANANFKEVIAWTGKGAVRTDNGVEVYPFPVNLYAQNYNLQHSGEIKSIKLPECPNLHIFAITLANSCEVL